MADIKKFLDQSGVSTLWGQVAAAVEAEAAEDAARTHCHFRRCWHTFP